MPASAAPVNSGTQVTGFPQAGQPFVEDNGSGSMVLTRPWQRFLANLWNKSGGGNALINAAYLTINNGVLSVYQAVTGQLIGQLAVFNNPGQPGVAQVLGASPFVFTSPGTGSLIVESGQVEISRDHGVTLLICSLTGGAIPVLKLDQVRVTWYNAKPKVTYLPS